MTAVTLSSKGQLVLPAKLRQRFGLVPGSQMELMEEPDGLRLIVARAEQAVNVESGFGMFKLNAKGRARRLADFDATNLLGKTGHKAKQP
ncbi:MAG: AbrB/MazE/SpoVT family DNA-binding domain-containing protein [Burkholderiaceae bacterium]|nr:AbrB/MazE/SpoVT family DNA-binding domain-containing protein [Burkholderiaceae bacterium]